MDDLKIGDRVVDNDKRTQSTYWAGMECVTAYRVLEVIELQPRFAVLVDDATGRCTKVRRDRIHTDGKPRRSGFSLLRDNGE